MYENILIPTDESKSSEAAIEHGLSLAEAFGSTVHSLYVIETKASYILTVSLSDEDMDEYQEHGEELVTEVVKQADARGLDGVGVVKSGRVAEEIVEYAEKNDIDGIVMGAGGRSAVDMYLMGSTAEKVVRTSDVPVTVVRP